ncbi:DUF4224 domain-containing protein [Pseudaeromonas paramecii]|uniref:DUF4224 domain-containing protein n=1 Tax=Pseudaeromonas paramecii TaxID=2138166 RepID=UPI003CD053F4
MTSLVVSEQEIQELTGYTRPTKQREVLDRMGIRYTVRRDGHIRTTRDWLAGTAATKPPTDDNFNLEALR